MNKTEFTKTLPLACVILAAGQGTRMKSSLPKVLHPIAGTPMIGHIIKACEALSPDKIVVVNAPGMSLVEKAVAPHPCVVQEKPLGTGDAAKAALESLKGFQGHVIVLFGDTPLLSPESLHALIHRHHDTNAAIVVAGFTPPNPGHYGRLVVEDKGSLSAIVEYKDATDEQLNIRLCNGGIMLFEADKLAPLLAELQPNNAKGEFYLTDCVALALAKNWTCTYVEIDGEDVRGVNSRIELAEAEKSMQRRLRNRAMLAGVTMTDPDSVFLNLDTKFGQDVTIGPNVVFGPNVSVGNNVEIRAFCHIEGTDIEPYAIIGPFARLRPGAVIGESAHIGNFVEIKNATVGTGAKINHLSYVGDASVGAKANVGAGTITCNYDGYTKAKTVIGAGAFIGSNTALVAPVTVGDGAMTAAGSTITGDVPADALGIARERQVNNEGWATRFRKQHGG